MRNLTLIVKRIFFPFGSRWADLKRFQIERMNWDTEELLREHFSTFQGLFSVLRNCWFLCDSWFVDKSRSSQPAAGRSNAAASHRFHGSITARRLQERRQHDYSSVTPGRFHTVTQLDAQTDRKLQTLKHTQCLVVVFLCILHLILCPFPTSYLWWAKIQMMLPSGGQKPGISLCEVSQPPF